MAKNLYTTSYPYPWALVIWNGQSAGKRPCTKMAFLKEAVAVDGHITHYRGFVLGAKTVRRFQPDAILKTWRREPSDAAIKRAKRGLKPAPPAPDLYGKTANT